MKDTDLRTLIEQGFSQINARLDRIEAEQHRHAESIAEVRGELRGLGTWLASMDNRFVAIMRPYEPPHRPA